MRTCVISAGIISGFFVNAGENVMVNASNKKVSSWRALNHIIQDKGVPALWENGLKATLIRDVGTTGLALLTPYARDHLTQRYQMSNNSASVISTLFLSTFSSVITQPLQVLRIAQQSDPKVSEKVFSTLKSIYKAKGLGKLFEAVHYRVIMNFGFFGSQIVAFDLIKWYNKNQLEES